MDESARVGVTLMAFRASWTMTIGCFFRGHLRIGLGLFKRRLKAMTKIAVRAFLVSLLKYFHIIYVLRMEKPLEKMIVFMLQNILRPDISG